MCRFLNYCKGLYKRNFNNKKYKFYDVDDIITIVSSDDESDDCYCSDICDCIYEESEENN